VREVARVPTAVRRCEQCQRTCSAEDRFCPACGLPLGVLKPASADPMVGRVLGGSYRVLEAIGAGGMGRVYRAEQVALGKTVAIKAIHPHLAGDEAAAARFYAEARACSRVNHPNAVSLLDFGRTDDGQLYLVMEFLRGRDLAHLVWEHGKLPAARAVDIVCQMLSALAEAHDHQVVHRDVKPENILVETLRTGGDFVKVLDFGLAKVLDAAPSRMTIPGLVCGTPEFMAPEQCQGDDAEPRSDQYSAAVVLYHCLTGRLPFEGEAPARVLLRQVIDPVPDPRGFVPELPEALVAAMLRALEKRPEARFPTALAFAGALRASLGVSESPPPPRARSGVICGFCSEDVPLGLRFCGNCGAPVMGTPSASTLRPVPSSSGAGAPCANGQTPALGALPFVGHAEERARVMALWARAQAGEFVVVRVQGEEGVGRHRLLERVLVEAQQTAMRVVRVGPDPTWAGVPYEPLARGIRQLLGLGAAADPMEWLESVGAAARGEVDPFVRAGFAEVFTQAGAAELDAQARVAAASRALRFALEPAQGRPPAVVVFSRLDRMDPASARVIAALLCEPLPFAGFVAVVHGPQWSPGALHGEEIALRGLSPAEALDLIQTTRPGLLEHGGIDLPGDSVSPLYIVQLLNWFAEGGGAAPRRTVDFVSARVERLPPDARRILQALAVLGEASADLIGEVAGQTVDDDVLSLLVRRGWVDCDGVNGHRRLRVAHPLYRDVLRASAPAAAAEDFHRASLRIAEHLELPVEVRAMHAAHAHDVFHALVLLETVGDRAIARGDGVSAARALRRALDLARRDLARGYLGESEGAVVIFARKLGEALMLCGDVIEAEGVLREGLGVAPRGSVEQLRLDGVLARILHDRRRLLEAQRLLEADVAAAQRKGFRAVAAELLAIQADLHAAGGRFAEAAESLRQGIALLRERGRTHDTEPPRRSQAALHLRRAEMLRRAGVDATDDLTIARGLVDEMGWVVGKALYEAEEAERAELRGESRRAVGAWRRAVAEARRAGDLPRAEAFVRRIERIGHVATPAMAAALGTPVGAFASRRP
jgi:serine/threonine protein kinase/tetratricopeptide (TPR) repeat protein